MNLPVPNAKEVAEFKRLYSKHRGVDLDDDTALDLSTRFLQFFYFGITKPPCDLLSTPENHQRKTSGKLNQSKTRKIDASNSPKQKASK